MAFITGRTNQRLSRKPPHEYLPGIIEQRGEAALLAQQIPMNRDLWQVNNYRAFLEERRRMLAMTVNGFIQKAFEVGSVSELEP